MNIFTISLCSNVILHVCFVWYYIIYDKYYQQSIEILNKNLRNICHPGICKFKLIHCKPCKNMLYDVHYEDMKVNK